jgi:hypothetical protein
MPTSHYEGHDHPKNAACSHPKLINQPGQLPSGKLTQNGKFDRAAQEFKAARRPPERVRVYEKIKKGIWSYNGIFHLVDSWQEKDQHRSVYKFRLIADKDTIVDAEVAPGTELETLIGRFSADPRVAYLHVHNARRGCYACRVDRL